LLHNFFSSNREDVVNFVFCYVYDEYGRPFVFLRATKDLKRGDVGWLDYGDHHWESKTPPEGRASLVAGTGSAPLQAAVEDGEQHQRDGDDLCDGSSRNDVTEGMADEPNSVVYWSSDEEEEISDGILHIESDNTSDDPKANTAAWSDSSSEEEEDEEEQLKQQKHKKQKKNKGGKDKEEEEEEEEEEEKEKKAVGVQEEDTAAVSNLNESPVTIAQPAALVSPGVSVNHDSVEEGGHDDIDGDGNNGCDDESEGSNNGELVLSDGAQISMPAVSTPTSFSEEPATNVVDVNTLSAREMALCQHLILEARRQRRTGGNSFSILESSTLKSLLDSVVSEEPAPEVPRLLSLSP
jgi:hypothetical protein